MQPLIVWRDDFRTGIASVDHEHRELIQAINDLHDDARLHDDKAAVDAVLADIHAGIAAHFALEEKVMRDGGYAGYAAHKAEHESLLDAIRDIMEEVRANPAYHYRDNLQERLRTWFVDHFKGADARFHRAAGIDSTH